MLEKLQQLKSLLREINDLESAAALLHWDQSTYMPSGGAAARGRQLATLSRLAHQKLTHDDVARLLDDLAPHETSLPYDSDDASLLRLARRLHDRAARVPNDFVARLVQHQSDTYDAWTKARPADDFKAVQPRLEKTLDLSREYSDFFPDRDHVADPLIDLADFGLKTAFIRDLFADLRRQLVPIVDAICAIRTDDACIHKSFPQHEQLLFARNLVSRMGYDFDRGRLDLTHHPFMTKFSLGDIRITTRVKDDDLSEAVFSTLHEAGHALYEQGIRWDLEATPLADGAAAGIHESQSRLWENVVGRSLGFWQHFYPDLQKTFPSQLGSVDLDTFYRAINKVHPSLIRTDADEVTYNLHVLIRFDLEIDMLEGKLAIADLPAAWNERYRQDLGITPPNDADGVLQDVHWFAHMIGGCFQGYTLGNLMAAQFYDTALAAHPHIPNEIAQGRFDTLRTWLTQNLYQHGAKFTTAELLQRATGQPLAVEPLITYIRQKYSPLYDLP